VPLLCDTDSDLTARPFSSSAVDFSFTLETNSGKVLNMFAAKGYICQSDKE
jgi:hypothetical protein